MAVTKITTKEVVELRRRKWTLGEIANWLGVTKQAVHNRLKMAGKTGLIPRQCPYCRKWKVNDVYKHEPWGRICQKCFDKRKAKTR